MIDFSLLTVLKLGNTPLLTYTAQEPVLIVSLERKWGVDFFAMVLEFTESLESFKTSWNRRPQKRRVGISNALKSHGQPGSVGVRSVGLQSVSHALEFQKKSMYSFSGPGIIGNGILSET